MSKKKVHPTLFYGAFIEKKDAEKRAKKVGGQIRKIKMRGVTRHQVFVKCD